MDPIKRLRRATEDDVVRACDVAPFDMPPVDEAQLLEFFNQMLDVMIGQGVSADD